MTRNNSRARKPMPKTSRRSVKVILTNRQWDELHKRAAEIGVPTSRIFGMLARKWLEGEITMEV